MMNGRRTTTENSTFAIGSVSCFADSLQKDVSSILLTKFNVKQNVVRIAANSYIEFYKTNRKWIKNY